MTNQKEQFGKHGYPLAPQNVSHDFWYYEEPKGICCIFQPRDAKGNLLFAIPAWYIPWKVLDQTLKRRSKALRRKRRARS